tara:strand:+ start:4428 stop:4688 length:261 start_codon:yes stop_codon:yes gene_type:complete
MKFFVYKTLFIALIFFLLFHLTFGYLIKSYEKKFYNNFSSEKIEQIKEKTREELRNALVKENILNKEDAILLNEFIKKLQKEINQK